MPFCGIMLQMTVWYYAANDSSYLSWWWAAVFSLFPLLKFLFVSLFIGDWTFLPPPCCDGTIFRSAAWCEYSTLFPAQWCVDATLFPPPWCDGLSPLCDGGVLGFLSPLFAVGISRLFPAIPQLRLFPVTCTREETENTKQKPGTYTHVIILFKWAGPWENVSYVKAQISLRIRAVWLAPLLFAA